MKNNMIIDKMLAGIYSLRKTDGTRAYTYELADKKVLHVFVNSTRDQKVYLSFLVNSSIDGTQYFTTECDEYDEVGIQSTVEYIYNRFIQQERTTRVSVSVEKKLMLTQEFDATPEQMLIIQDGGNPFEKEMDALFEKASALDFDNDYCIENLDTDKILVPWND